MKIVIDRSHNPMRGTVRCTHCGTPLVHVEDKWHNEFAAEVAKAMPHIAYDAKHPLNATPREFYPLMAQKAANILAARVDHYLFCPYCGEALKQPRKIEGSDDVVLPGLYYNVFRAKGDNPYTPIKLWAESLGLAHLPIDDYHKLDEVRYAQHQISKVVFTWE